MPQPQFPGLKCWCARQVLGAVGAVFSAWLEEVSGFEGEQCPCDPSMGPPYVPGRPCHSPGREARSLAGGSLRCPMAQLARWQADYGTGSAAAWRADRVSDWPWDPRRCPSQRFCQACGHQPVPTAAAPMALLVDMWFSCSRMLLRSTQARPDSIWDRSPSRQPLPCLPRSGGPQPLVLLCTCVAGSHHLWLLPVKPPSSHSGLLGTWGS